MSSIDWHNSYRSTGCPFVVVFVVPAARAREKQRLKRSTVKYFFGGMMNERWPEMRKLLQEIVQMRYLRDGKRDVEMVGVVAQEEPESHVYRRNMMS
jgi:hypothetical protein